jgi:hypothetical protein
MPSHVVEPLHTLLGSVLPSISTRGQIAGKSSLVMGTLVDSYGQVWPRTTCSRSSFQGLIDAYDVSWDRGDHRPGLPDIVSYRYSRKQYD